MTRYRIKSDHITKVIDTDDYISKDLDAIFENEIELIHKEENREHKTKSTLIKIKEVRVESNNRT